MRKTITREVTFCDKCKREVSYPITCLRCRMEVCYNCQSKTGVTYSHLVYGGAGGGFYCTPCDIALSESNDDPLHLAYRAVRALHDEHEASHAQFKRQQELVEGRLALLIEQSPVTT